MNEYAIKFGAIDEHGEFVELDEADIPNENGTHELMKMIVAGGKGSPPYNRRLIITAEYK